MGQIRDEWSYSARIPAIAKAQNLDAMAAYFRKWLVLDAQEYDDYYTKASRQVYTYRASKPLQQKEKKIYTFAPLQRQLSAFRTITIGQGIILVLGIDILVVSFAIQPILTLTALLGLITLIYFINFVISTIAIARVILHSPEERVNERIIATIEDKLWPTYTILCPLYREVEVVPQFVQAIEALDYPKEQLQVLFLTEVNDTETRQAILDMRLPPHFQVLTVPDGEPRTKPRACNYGLIHATGRYVVIYDAEDIPDPLQLKKAVLTFAHHRSDVVCVQAKLSFYNPEQNLLTRWFALEYALWFNFTLPGLQWIGLSLPLGGTSNHFRTSILQRLGGWDPYNVTEDCDLGLRLTQYRLHTAVLDSITLEEANSNFKNWIRQRSRWTKGYFQTYLVHMRRPWKFLNPKRWREFISLQLIVGASPATFFVNPIMWVLLVIYIVERPHVANIYTTLYISPIYYLALTCLIWGNFLYFYMYFLACARTRQYGLMIAIPAIMLYWLMMSIAAVMAGYQLIVKPHFWEKTKHGLHLKQSNKLAPVPSPAHQHATPRW
jgi:glycosyltransferase XagB